MTDPENHRTCASHRQHSLGRALHRDLAQTYRLLNCHPAPVLRVILIHSRISAKRRMTMPLDELKIVREKLVGRRRVEAYRVAGEHYDTQIAKLNSVHSAIQAL